MKFAKYKKDFEIKATNLGYTAENIERCLNYARPLIDKGFPVIYNTSHLSDLVGYRKDFIKRAVKHTPYFYRNFKIKKKDGKFREISEPLPSLKEIQDWILTNILEVEKVSPFAKAYRKKVGLLDNVKFHVKQAKILTLDLKDFFTSIKREKVELIFLSFGYSDLIANLFSKLCTKDGFLPQGAPTSPYLSNIFFKIADDAICKYCLDNNIRYTRYADDLNFSGMFDEKKLIEHIKYTIHPMNLFLHPNKIKIIKQNQRQTITGIVVNEKPQVVFHKRNKLRQEMYYIIKFGIQTHMQNKNIKFKNYIQHLMGKINFILQLNPNDMEFQKYRSHLIELKNKQ
jgi:RNA-directed DNA polymerase